MALKDNDRGISLGMVLAFGFIMLGILSLFGGLHYRKASPISATRLPGLLFILTGVIILVVRAIRKPDKP
jgi:lipopolysaccharide export LptBFGC system permease protein LptF